MDQKGYESTLSSLSPSSVSHSGGDGEEEEQMSMHEVRSMFMEELDESFSVVCLEEAKDACRRLSTPISKGIPLVVSALRYKEKWGIEGWLAGLLWEGSSSSGHAREGFSQAEGGSSARRAALCKSKIPAQCAGIRASGRRHRSTSW